MTSVLAFSPINNGDKGLPTSMILYHELGGLVPSLYLSIFETSFLPASGTPAKHSKSKYPVDSKN